MEQFPLELQGRTLVGARLEVHTYRVVLPRRGVSDADARARVTAARDRLAALGAFAAAAGGREGRGIVAAVLREAGSEDTLIFVAPAAVAAEQCLLIAVLALASPLPADERRQLAFEWPRAPP